MQLSLKEFIWILFFCLSYAIIANIESRIIMPGGSLAQSTRAWAMSEIDKVNRGEAMLLCKEFASYVKSDDVAVIWYYDTTTAEYWCGMVKLNNLTVKRAIELKPHITVLNIKD